MPKQRTLEENIARDQFAAAMLPYFAEDHKLGDRFFEFLGDTRNQHYKRTQRQVAEAAYDMADVMMRARNSDLEG